MKKKRRRTSDKISRRMRGRLVFVFGLICILFVVLIARIMYIQRTSGERYEKIVLSQQEYDSRIIPYQRGDITDAKGTVLATSIDVYNVILDCKVLNANSEDIDTTIMYLTQVFPEISAETVRSELISNPDGQYKILAKKTSYEQMAAFTALMDSEDVGDSISGIWFEKEYIRNYPYNTAAAAVIGFTASGNAGVSGLEMQYNDTLNGVNGRSYGYLNNDSNLEQTVIEPENGRTIVTSLDINIQSVVESAIIEWNNEYASDGNLGSLNTACLVMNPQNGEILAMATYPGFDANNPRDLSFLYTEEQLNEMTEDEKLERLNKLWQNYTVSSTYEPGSTFKPFTVACGLETGTLIGDETFYCDGGEEISGYRIRCVNRNGHGMETIADSLMDSCNDALMQMSYRIGAKNFAEYQHLFGFGQRTYIDLPGEARTDSLIYTVDDLEKTVNIATNSFGQNFNTTMVQLGSAFCSLVNGGNLYQPHVVTKITDREGNVLEEIDPIVEKETVSEEVSAQMREYLRMVVQDGTGKIAGVEGYDIGGKTGTAQKLPRTERNFLVSFIGFAPVSDPQVVVYTIIDVPNTPDQAHSNYAQSITHNVFEQILPYMNIQRSNDVSEAGDENEVPVDEHGPIAVPESSEENTVDTVAEAEEPLPESVTPPVDNGEQ